MPRATHCIDIGGSCEAVFDVVHDYERRLEWDSMLRRASLLGGATAAHVGVRSLCVGTWRGGLLALETQYVRFERGQVAAVKLTNQPPFFGHFAATIKHTALGEGRSRTTYIYSFRARPRVLAPILEPIMKVLLSREVRHRLRALRTFVEQNERAGGTAA